MEPTRNTCSKSQGQSDRLLLPPGVFLLEEHGTLSNICARSMVAYTCGKIKVQHHNSCILEDEMAGITCAMTEDL